MLFIHSEYAMKKSHRNRWPSDVLLKLISNLSNYNILCDFPLVSRLKRDGDRLQPAYSSGFHIVIGAYNFYLAFFLKPSER